MLGIRPLLDAQLGRVEMVALGRTPLGERRGINSLGGWCYHLPTGLRFETGASDLDWLNCVIAIARGARRPRAVDLNAFELL